MPKQIELDAAITDIAQLVYPYDTLRAAKKKIRGVFDYAKHLGHISLVDKGASKKPMVLKRGFECWAADKWPQLKARFQTPTIGVMNGVLPKIEAAFIGVPIPNDNADLTTQLVKIAAELIRTQQELEICKATLVPFQQGAVERKAKDEVTSQKKSEAGKIGGRGRWKKQP